MRENFFLSLPGDPDTFLLNSLSFTKNDCFTTSNLIQLLDIKAQTLTNLLGGVSFHLGNLSPKLFKFKKKVMGYMQPIIAS